MSLVPRRPLAAIAALGAAALIAGCGGGSDSSADDFREQADEICAQANARTGALAEPATSGEVLPYLESGLTIQGEELERIRALDPPEDLQPAFDEATDLLQQRQDAIRQAADRVSAGEDPDAVIAEVSPEITRLRDEGRAKARELGLTVCGSEEDDAGSTAPATTGTAPQTGGTAPAQSGQAQRYAADLQAAGTALQGFGGVLQGTTRLDDLRSRVPEANAALDEFEAAIGTLEGYTLDNATLESQRARLAETGPEVSDTLRRFVAAAESGDTEAVQALVPEVTQAISAFQAAATTAP